jgi:metallo-beta-lactamase class B
MKAGVFAATLITAVSINAFAQPGRDRGPQLPPILESSSPTAQAHIAAAKTVAGTSWAELFPGLCDLRNPNRPFTLPNPPAPRTPFEPDDWNEQPAQIFDNLYFVGSKGVSSFAITTSEGIIITDAMWVYDIEGSVVDGLKTLGLDPHDIKYVIIPHGHPDHYGGAKFLQDNFDVKVVAPRGELELLSVGPRYSNTPLPNSYDVLIEDGDTLTLGDTSVHFTTMPGHTEAGVVLTFPVVENNQTHQMLIWPAGGGTPGGTDGQLAQARALAALIETAKEKGIDAIAENHGSHLLINNMQPSDAGNPFLVGTDTVVDYLTLRMECDLARAENALAKD